MTRRFRQEYSSGPRGFSRWVQPNPSKYLMSCCDCNLVHEMQFRILTAKTTGKQHVQFRARRAPRLTAQQRKLRSKTPG